MTLKHMASKTMQSAEDAPRDRARQRAQHRALGTQVFRGEWRSRIKGENEKESET